MTNLSCKLHVLNYEHAIYISFLFVFLVSFGFFCFLSSFKLKTTNVLEQPDAIERTNTLFFENTPSFRMRNILQNSYELQICKRTTSVRRITSSSCSDAMVIFLTWQNVISHCISFRFLLPPKNSHTDEIHFLRCNFSSEQTVILTSKNFKQFAFALFLIPMERRRRRRNPFPNFFSFVFPFFRMSFSLLVLK